MNNVPLTDEENKELLPDRTELTKLYPEAKSYAQLEDERLQRSEAHRAQQPRWQPLKLSFHLAVLVTATYVIASNGWVLMLFGVIAGVFMAFLLCIVLVGYLYGLFQFAVTIFERKNRSPTFAIAVLLVAVTCAMYCVEALSGSLPVVVRWLIIAIGSFGTAYGLIAVSLTDKVADSHKVLVMLLVAAVSLLAASIVAVRLWR